ncbi:MAG: 16S rRNA (cytosine(1402)-N(4))-methyltransferase RsmH [Kiritimatiellae bacterium]|nr:16S rRNA (cytosine(1402)-N(4))-methyltransferase RsmH [Kiritimatiellia bacterium]
MHIPVLLNETIDGLLPSPNASYIDGTLGGAGHSRELLKRAGNGAKLLGLDRDPAAIERCTAALNEFGKNVTIVHTPFSLMGEVAPKEGFDQVDGIMLDLGVSSFQLDERERGFSFMGDAPLDMRMDNSSGITAAEYLDSFGDDWKSLASVLFDYGEETQAAKIARAIINAQHSSPIKTTLQLADIVEKAVGGRKGAPRHPATKTFQAIRIAINSELQEVKKGIEAAISLLKPGGRLAVISFHSIEDRVVKKTLAEHEGRWESLQQGGAKWIGTLPAVKRVNKHPIVASQEELVNNPRARSAKLRVVERI